MPRMVTVATFGCATELMLARARLTGSGIPCFVPDELSLTAQDYLVPGSGYRLEVPADAAEDARAILAHEPDEDEPEDETGVHCGACGSPYVVLETSRLTRALNLLFFGMMRRWQRPLWRCRKCGHESEELPSPPALHPYRT